MFLLDTNVISELRKKGRGRATVVTRNTRQLDRLGVDVINPQDPIDDPPRTASRG